MTDNQLEHLKQLAIKEVSRNRDVWNEEDPDRPGRAIDLFIAQLEQSGRLLPPGGVTIDERGIRRGMAVGNLSANISRVGRAFPGRYTRTVTVWPVDGEPNDNWPKYIGPWREETTQGLP